MPEATKALRHDATRQLLTNINFGETLDISFQCDHFFVVGELGYEIDLQAADGTVRSHDEHFAQINSLIKSKDYSRLQEADQLQLDMTKRLALVGFSEGEILYAPTALVEPEAVGMYSDYELPSYSDRILFRSHPGAAKNLAQSWIYPAFDVRTSYHVPLVSQFQLAVRRQPADAHDVFISLQGIQAKLHGNMRLGGGTDLFLRFSGPGLLCPSVGETTRSSPAVSADGGWRWDKTTTLRCRHGAVRSILLRPVPLN